MSARARVATIAAIAHLAVAGSPGAQSTDAVDALERWVTAVGRHQAGRPDEAVASVVSLTYDARVELNSAMRPFIARLRGQRTIARGDAARKIAALARGVEEKPGLAPFLERAAMLHADALVFSDRFPAPPKERPSPDGRGPAASRGGQVRVPHDEVPPLLWNERSVLTRDGQVLGETTTTWHLPFARSLLDLLFEPARAAAREGDDFAGEWYHAVAAYLFANGRLADLTRHLARAEQVLPDDPRQVFDRATYAEILGLPIYQAVRDEPQPWLGVGVSAQLPPEGQTNGDAVRLYRRTLEIDPEYVEARVRLARLLDHRGQHDEAAVEIARALASGPSGAVGFYAHLVAGRVAAARGRYEDALQQYGAALSLFGAAQSALLGASHAALMAADVPRALSPLERLGASDAEADPWRDYLMGAGRDANPLMAHLWARVPKS